MSVSSREDNVLTKKIHFSNDGAISQLFRSEVWQTCLEVEIQDKEHSNCSVTFGLGTIKRDFVCDSLREDCLQFVAARAYGEGEKASVIEDLESVIIFYSKTTKVQYVRGNGWMEILGVLLSLKLHIVITYKMFKAIQNKYIFNVSERNTTSLHLFRLLVLYHDPEMCSFLDSKRAHPKLYSCTWFQTLFAAKCSLEAVQRIWDGYLRKSDPFYIFFLALVLLIHAKETFMAMCLEDTENIVAMLSNLPCSLQSDDIPDFFHLADYYASITPSSFKSPNLIGILLNPTVPTDLYSQELCLSIHEEELHTSIAAAKEQNKQGIRYFIIDCRPKVQYMSGHLPTAYHLDCDLVIQQPSIFGQVVADLLMAQRGALAVKSPVCGEHICFMSSGRNEEDQYLNMVVAAFLKKHTQHVSIVAGGYQSIHLDLSENSKCFDTYFVDHNPSNCLVCLKDKYVPATLRVLQTPTLSSAPDVLEKIRKLTSQMVSCHLSNICKEHVSNEDNTSKVYRNIRPVFSIDDDVDESSLVSEEETSLVSPTVEYLQSQDTIEAFRCWEISMAGCRMKYSGHVVLEKSHIIVLRDVTGRQGYSKLAGLRSYGDVIKITSPKLNPELIVFRYRNSRDGDSENVIVDKYLLAKDPNIFLKHVFKQIEKIDQSHAILQKVESC